MMRTPIFPLILLAVVLGGCGNKGPLVRAPVDEVPEAPSAAESDAGAEADPPPADQADDAPLPVDTMPAPPPDAAADDPPGDG